MTCAARSVVIPAYDLIHVIGDVHGDYELVINCLRLARVIDDSLSWVGGKSLLVQVGDLVDRCRPTNPTSSCADPHTTQPDEASDIKIIELLTTLQAEALKAGGDVRILLGNHELMNLQGNIAYASYENLVDAKNRLNPQSEASKPFNVKNLSSKPCDAITTKALDTLELLNARQKIFAPGGELSKKMACTMQTALITGEYMFVHAGLVKQYLDQRNITSRDAMELTNRQVHSWLLGETGTPDFVSNTRENMQSPFWTRVLGCIPPNITSNDDRCKELDSVLKLFQVGSLVIGHTPQFINNTGMNGTCSEGDKYKLYRVDTGSSDAFKKFYTDDTARRPQVLKIHNNKVYVVSCDPRNCSKTITSKLC